MHIVVDQNTEVLIQREIDRGHFRNPQEVIAHALALLEAQEDWLAENREAIHQKIEASFQQVERGEFLTATDARTKLAVRKKIVR